MELADSVEEADITVLDKVVCCYDNFDELVRKSLDKTKRIYALSQPRNGLIAWATFFADIQSAKLLRSDFHPFWHDWPRIYKMVLAAGFEPVYENQTPVWQIVVFRRTGR